MTVLSARGIRKHYGGLEVVAGIALELRRGECFLHRRANLEDLFLKLTGREMRE